MVRRGYPRACFVLLLALLWFPLAAQTPEEIFLEGNAAYDEKRFEDAAAAYETLLRYKILDPRVEYNLGNARFRLDQLGLAILHYERARRLAPTDRDILANLEYARSFCQDRVEPAAVPALLRVLYGLQDRLGPDRQAWIALAVVWGLCAWLAWCLALPGRWKASSGWGLSALLLVLVLTLSSWYATYRRIEGRHLAVVIDPSVEVLSGPGGNNATLATVHEGLTIEVREFREEWVHVSLPDGLNGWLPVEAVGVV